VSDIVERLRTQIGAPGGYYHGIAAEAADELERLTAELDVLRRATGGLDPALVAKALDFTAELSLCLDGDMAHEDGFTLDEIDALRAATFEAPA
jgi:hypothetical protein